MQNKKRKKLRDAEMRVLLLADFNEIIGLASSEDFPARCANFLRMTEGEVARALSMLAEQGYIEDGHVCDREYECEEPTLAPLSDNGALVLYWIAKQPKVRNLLLANNHAAFATELNMTEEEFRSGLVESIVRSMAHWPKGRSIEGEDEPHQQA